MKKPLSKLQLFDLCEFWQAKQQAMGDSQTLTNKCSFFSLALVLQQIPPNKKVVMECYGLQLKSQHWIIRWSRPFYPMFIALNGSFYLFTNSGQNPGQFQDLFLEPFLGTSDWRILNDIKWYIKRTKYNQNNHDGNDNDTYCDRLQFFELRYLVIMATTV